MNYTLKLEPLPCPRPRIAVRGKFPTAYYPATYQTWKTEAVKLLTAGSQPMFAGPLRLRAVFTVARPKSTKLVHPKADVDNYLKSLMDALTQAGWWEDDSQVASVSARKQWAAPGVEGSITFNIEEMTE